MEPIPITKARDMLGDLASRVLYGHERIILTKHNRRFALIPIEDLEALEALEDAVDVRAADIAKRETDEHGTEAWEDIKKQSDL